MTWLCFGEKCLVTTAVLSTAQSGHCLWSFPTSSSPISLRERYHVFIPTLHDRWQQSDVQCFEHMRVTATGTWTPHCCFSSQLVVTDTHCDLLWRQAGLSLTMAFNKVLLSFLLLLPAQRRKGISRRRHTKRHLWRWAEESFTQEPRFCSYLLLPS